MQIQVKNQEQHQPAVVPVRNPLFELQAMIAGTVAAFPNSKDRRRALMAIQWRLVDADGRSVHLNMRGGDTCFAWCHRDEGIIFDGRDNETLKIRYFSAMMKTPLFIDIIPQITRG